MPHPKRHINDDWASRHDNSPSGLLLLLARHRAGEPKPVRYTRTASELGQAIRGPGRRRITPQATCVGVVGAVVHAEGRVQFVDYAAKQLIKEQPLFQMSSLRPDSQVPAMSRHRRSVGCVCKSQLLTFVPLHSSFLPLYHRHARQRSISLSRVGTARIADTAVKHRTGKRGRRDSSGDVILRVQVRESPHSLPSQQNWVALLTI
jgi:hypothetical protein